MSFLRSKHSGWTWDGKRTPFGGGGDPFQGISDTVSQAFSTIDLGGSLTPIIAPAVALGTAALTGGASLALDAGAIAAADGVALSTYGVPAAQAMAEYGATAAELGLPAAATAADVGAVAGTASAHGKASQTAQTKGTEHYMPMNTSYDDGKSMKVKSSNMSTQSGPGKSIFN